MTDYRYQLCRAWMVELVVKGEYEKATRLRDFMRRRGLRCPPVGGEDIHPAFAELENPAEMNVDNFLYLVDQPKCLVRSNHPSLN